VTRGDRRRATDKLFSTKRKERKSAEKGEGQSDEGGAGVAGLFRKDWDIIRQKPGVRVTRLGVEQTVGVCA